MCCIGRLCLNLAVQRDRVGTRDQSLEPPL
jgi:hypothetical protein